ncbi:MAG: ABC transporter substrate-binding protein [Candidatus Omnitrophica bacterium]|nr:ABC transporter substrate-binding protein [Candidatus Omnitrophota bacterium]
MKKFHVLITVLAVLTLSPLVMAAEQHTVTFGALLCLRGERASVGEACKAAIEAAEEDINAYLASTGSLLKVTFKIEDTRTDSSYASGKLQDFKDQNIMVVIGPQTSSEARMIKDFADTNGMILLSPSATAPSLGISEDNLFRFCPDDTNQAAIIAQLLSEDKVKAAVEIHRNDLWGRELTKSAKAAFERSGGLMNDGAVYNSDTRDFRRPLTVLDSKLGEILARYPESGAVAVYYVGFDEFATMFYQTQDRPALGKVRWYGTESTSHDEKFLVNKAVADFARDVKFTCPSYAVSTDPSQLEKYNSVLEKVRGKIGRDPGAYALTAYDIAWLAVKTYVAAGTDKANEFKKALFTVAKDYQGITGPMMLNARGDRAVFAYDVWSVKDENGAIKWVKTGKSAVNPDGTIRIERI